MKIKICGMRNAENIQEIISLNPDYLGFIFYPKSKRYVGEKWSPQIVDSIPSSIQKVGVFVNTKLSEILGVVIRYKLDLVQLHGTESPELCQQLQLRKIRVVKAFGIGPEFDFKKCEAYLPYISMFLWDTVSPIFGGTGKSFDWNQLKNYSYQKPFLLSGGLGLENASDWLKITHPYLMGFDLNSRLEFRPANKDLNRTSKLFSLIHQR